MQSFRLALIQAAWQADGNALRSKYASMVRDAVQNNARLIVLPEFTLSPYFAAHPESDIQPESIPDGPSCAFFSNLARGNQAFVVGSLYEDDATVKYDTAVIFGPDGSLTGVCRKQHIPDDIGYYERNYFVAGDSDYPVFKLPFVKVSAPTCYDQWFPELARIHALKGSQLLVYPTAIGSEPSQPGFDSKPAWQAVICGHAVANGIFVAAANRVGEENGQMFYGSSFIAGPDGRIIAEASRDAEDIVVADIDTSLMTTWRRLFPLLQRREPATYSRITQID